MSRSERERIQKLAMWRRDSRCHYCLRETTLEQTPDGRCPPHFATIEHLRSRLHPGRRETPKNGERRLVLACWQCNNRLGALEYQALPLEEKHRRSGSYPEHHSESVTHEQAR